MVTNKILQFIAVIINGLLALIPKFAFTADVSESISTLTEVLGQAAYFLPVTAVKVYFTGVVGYYAFIAGKYVIMLLIKYITRLL
jgi:hypothetical protein